MKTCRVEVRTGFLIFFAVYYFINPANTFWPFCIAAALHEGGHLLALRMQGLPIHSISLRATGTVIGVGELSYRQELLVSAAGPFVNVLLFLLALHRNPYLALMNFGLFCYNMLPLYPLDGGRILRSLLRGVLSDDIADCLEKGIATMCLLCLAGGSVYLTCILHAGLWPVLVCAFLIFRVGGTILSISIFPLDKRNNPCYNNQANSERCPSGLRSRS